MSLLYKMVEILGVHHLRTGIKRESYNNLDIALIAEIRLDRHQGKRTRLLRISMS
jgi:hypothetical protein